MQKLFKLMNCGCLNLIEDKLAKQPHRWRETARILLGPGSSLPRVRLSVTDWKRKLKFKAGVHMKAVFWLGIMFFMQISCLRFKQSRISLFISHIYVLGCFGNFLVIFRYIWREMVFLKELVKLMEIGNFEDLLLF